MVHTVDGFESALPGLHVLDILSDRQFPRHAHDQYGVGLMLDGGHKSWSGRGQVEAGPNHVITVNPNEIHDGLPIRGKLRRWRMMFIDPQVISDVLGTELAAREFSDPVMIDHCFACRIGDALWHLPDADTHEAAGIVVDVCGALLVGTKRASSCAEPSLGVRRMLDRIHDNPAEAPSLHELAGFTNLSPFSALRGFQREVGVTPHAYLIQVRVRRAYKAICKGNSLAEAAFVAGFADQSHMTRAFVRQFGFTPGKARSLQDPSRRRSEKRVL